MPMWCRLYIHIQCVHKRMYIHTNVCVHPTDGHVCNTYWVGCRNDVYKDVSFSTIFLMCASYGCMYTYHSVLR